MIASCLIIPGQNQSSGNTEHRKSNDDTKLKIVRTIPDYFGISEFRDVFIEIPEFRNFSGIYHCKLIALFI